MATVDGECLAGEVEKRCASAEGERDGSAGLASYYRQGRCRRRVAGENGDQDRTTKNKVGRVALHVSVHVTPKARVQVRLGDKMGKSLGVTFGDSNSSRQGPEAAAGRQAGRLAGPAFSPEGKR